MVNWTQHEKDLLLASILRIEKALQELLSYERLEHLLQQPKETEDDGK
jgi:hypothetical protein